jgi:formate-dependent nitrite reductase membrane component NrfD
MHEPPWGILIVVYLFLAGGSAGAFITSTVMLLVTGEKYRRTIAWGAYLTPIPISLGTGLLVLDLGRPLGAYRLFLTIVPTSPMSFGSWLLTLFITLSMVYTVLWLPPKWLSFGLRFVPKKLRDHLDPEGPTLVRTRRVLAGVGLPLALGVAIYTAILLGAAALPLWTLPLMPVLFVTSATSSGLAAVTFCVLLAARRDEPTDEGKREVGLLVRADLGLLVIELLVLVLMVLYSRLGTLPVRHIWDVLLTGKFAMIFWLGPVLMGVVAPILLDVIELRHERHAPPPKPTGHRLPWLGLIICLFVMAGGFALRYVIVYAGQTPWGVEIIRATVESAD